MCGRFTLHTPASRLAEFFELLREPALQPRYNIAPGQSVAAIRFEETGAPRELVTLRWGLVPSWAKDAKIAYRTINARGETAAEKPAFRAAFKRRRCLIPADGFFEWKETDEKQKQPYYITLRSEEPFAFAGLWEHWTSGDGSELESCTIVTTEANQQMSELHERMPVILHETDYDRWLDPLVEKKELLQPLLRPFDENALKFVPVSRTVNRPQNDSPECIAPAAVQGELF